MRTEIDGSSTLAMTLLWLVLALAGCSVATQAPGDGNSTVRERTVVVAEPEPPEAWDEVLVFDAPGTREEICAALALGDAKCADLTPVRVEPDHLLLVFRSGGGVVRVEQHARFAHPLAPASDTQ